jgi:undecaprenyl-diphosphatase
MAELDLQLLLRVNRTFAGPILDSIMIMVSYTYTWIVVAVMVLVYGAYRRNFFLLKWLLITIVAVAVSDVVSSYLIKPWVARIRPCHEHAASVRAVLGCAGIHSFPSNHAMNAFTVAGTAFFNVQFRRRWLLLGLAGLVALSRVYLGAHYPGDVIAGAVFGLLIGAGFGRLLYRRSSKESP